MNKKWPDKNVSEEKSFMIASKNIYKVVVILFIAIYTTACQEEGQNNKDYETVCVDADTSVKDDVADDGILWSLTNNDLKYILSLVTQESDRDIYIMNSITTCDMTFKDIKIHNNICEITLNAGAYGYVECSDGSKYSFGCYKDECSQYFPFPYEEQN